MTPAARPGANLPAPYVSPWQRLRRDLRDLQAWTGLKIRELVRRNGQADLPRPFFWPVELAPLFWPLVLLGAVVVLTWAGLQLLSDHSPAREIPPPQDTTPFHGSSRSGGEDGSDSPPPASIRPEDLDRDSPLPGDRGTSLPSAPSIPTEDAPPRSRTPSGSAEGERRSASPATADQIPSAALPESAEHSGDQKEPLLALFNGEEESRALVTGVQIDPARGDIHLHLSVAFGSLQEDLRQRMAERWQRQAAEMGYERLELLDSSGRLLGRNALVGSGMILLDAAAM